MRSCSPPAANEAKGAEMASDLKFFTNEGQLAGKYCSVAEIAYEFEK
jgi:hypothetical protein